MFQLEWPLVLLLIPLPLLVYLALPASALQQQAALRVPVINDFRLGAMQANEVKPQRWRQWLGLLAWLLLVLAASRPQWLGESIAIPVSGRDLMLAVDLSDSMRTGDFKIRDQQVNRLQATKQVASKFIERRRGDRLGLILFGTQAAARPPKFVVFSTGFLEAGYRRFIIRKLRETYGFEGSPVELGVRVRERRKRLR